jgi:hypothetical protein
VQCDESVSGTFNVQNWIGIERRFIDNKKIYKNFGKRNFLNAFNVGDPLIVRRFRWEPPRLGYPYALCNNKVSTAEIHKYSFHTLFCL